MRPTATLKVLQKFKHSNYGTNSYFEGATEIQTFTTLLVLSIKYYVHVKF